MDPGGYSWWILVEPCDGPLLIHTVDPGKSTWWTLVDPHGRSRSSGGSWWILGVDPYGGSTCWLLLNSTCEYGRILWYLWVAPVVDPDISWWILENPSDSYWWSHIVDSGGSIRFMLVDPHGGCWWIQLVVQTHSSGSSLIQLVDPSFGCWWIHIVDSWGPRWWIFMDPSYGSFWTHVMDPDESAW